MQQEQRSIVYPTLTRPDFVLGGVPRAFLPVAIVMSAVIGIFAQNLLIGLVFFPFIIFGGFMGAKVDPDFMEVWKAKRQWIKRTKGNQGGNYYHA